MLSMRTTKATVCRIFRLIWPLCCLSCPFIMYSKTKSVSGSMHLRLFKCPRDTLHSWAILQTTPVSQSSGYPSPWRSVTHMDPLQIRWRRPWLDWPVNLMGSGLWLTMFSWFWDKSCQGLFTLILNPPRFNPSQGSSYTKRGFSLWDAMGNWIITEIG